MYLLRSRWIVLILGLILLGAALMSYLHSDHGISDSSTGGSRRLQKLNRESELGYDQRSQLEKGIGSETWSGSAQQNRRKQTITHGCKAMRMKPSYHLYNHLTPQQVSSLDHFIVVDDLKMFYCCVPHAGCRTWQRILEDAVQKQHRGKSWGRSRVLRDYPLGDVRSILRDYSSFIFTRNPYYRLLSAFLTIFPDREVSNADQSIEEIRRLYAAKIKRHSASNGAVNSTISFADFTDYVSDSANRLMSKDEDQLREMYRLCHLCGVEYDFVGNYETFESDSQEILRQYALAGNLGGSNPTGPDEEIGVDVMKRYLSQLSPVQLKRFSKRFVADKFLFGYVTP